MKKELKKFIKHPIKSYFKGIKHSVIPEPYSHSVKMNILIKKGQQSGTALIPCVIYAMDHSIDLNPALIRKKDKKIVKIYKSGKKIRYNSNEYDLELTEDERNKGYVLRELERCKHCGQKLVLAELKQTRYRSCPSIEVKLADPAKKDISIPVEFGVNKSDIINHYWSTPIIVFITIILTLILFGVNILEKISISGNSYEVPSIISISILFLLLSFLWLYLVPRTCYKTYKLFKWYYKVKPTMKKTRYAY